MDFTLLGPVTVHVANQEIRVPAAKQRIVLAALLVNPNQVVPVERIISFVWGNSPPPTAKATIRTYVMRLRQVLGPEVAARITTQDPGYLMSLSEEETDLGRCRLHRARATLLAQERNPEGAVHELNQALALWGPDSLLDIPSQTLRDTEVPALQELRLQTLTWRIDLELALGRHTDVLPELRQIVNELPLNESLVARLMRALARSGRQNEAFAVFHKTRAALVEQLGVEPGAALRNAQRCILQPDPPPRGPSSPLSSDPITVVERKPRPAQLPGRIPDFIGRAGAYAQLSGLLGSHGQRTAAVTGAGGAGKTTLAVQVAWEAQSRFSDGHLFANLTSTEGLPVPPQHVLAHVLSSLGVPKGEIPQNLTDLVALFRSRMARSNVLMVLDGAHNAAQVRPLLPGSDSSRVIITSRAGLSDLDGVRPLQLRTFAEPEALDLLTRILGRDRIDAEKHEARMIVAACEFLPLAVRIAGARLLARPNWSLAKMAARLSDPARVLNELHIGDLSVRPLLDATYTALADTWVAGIDVLRSWRHLAGVEQSTFTVQDLAMILNSSAADAEDVLDLLVDAHLLEGQPYRIGHLHRAYACELSTPTDRKSAHLLTPARRYDRRHHDETTSQCA